MNKRIIEVLSAFICNIVINYFLGGIATCTFVAGWIFAMVFTLTNEQKEKAHGTTRNNSGADYDISSL